MKERYRNVLNCQTLSFQMFKEHINFVMLKQLYIPGIYSYKEENSQVLVNAVLFIIKFLYL